MGLVMGNALLIIIAMLLLGFVCTFKPDNPPASYGLLKSLMVIVSIVLLIIAIVRII